MPDNDFKAFNWSAFKMMVMIGVDTSPFPNLSEEFMRGAREALKDDEKFEWLLKERQRWEDKKPDEPDEPSGEVMIAKFDIEIEMKHQHALDEGHHDCGWWWTKAALNVIYEVAGTTGQAISTYDRKIFVRKSPHSTGTVSMAMTPIPAEAIVISAVLTMVFDAHEGIAWADDTGLCEIRSVDGQFIRNLSAKDDIKGKGYNKNKRNLPVDFTPYVQALYAQQGVLKR